MNSKFIIIFLLLQMFFLQLFSQTGIIKGRVFDANNNEPIPFANIIIDGTNIGSTSDLDGNFIFENINPGFTKLQVSVVGYERKNTEEFMVSSAKAFYIEIPMLATALNLEEVEIKAKPFKRKEESPVSMRTLGISDIEKNPGSNRDISRVIQAFPGVASSVAYRNDVIVRGGGPNENTFYLDGVEIPNLNHFSTQGASGGPVGIINVDFIREVDFYSGAFPANRGGAMSSILEMQQIEGNNEKFNFKGTVGASDLALTIDGPVSKKSTMIFSVRRSYLQFLFDALGLPFLPTYNDIQFKNKIKFNTKNELTFIGLGALDQFNLNTGLKDPDESQQYILNYLPVNEQWSYTVGTVYRHFKDNGYGTYVLSRNHLDNSFYKYRNNDESSKQNLIQDYNSTETENKFRYEHTSRMNGFKINYGLGLESTKYTNNTYQLTFSNSFIDTLIYDTELEMLNYNLFGQISKGFLEERLILSLGLRTDASDYSSNMSNPISQLSPRLSASYALSEKFYLNFNTGRYFQKPPYTTLGYKNNQDIFINKENNLKFIKSDHLVAGVEYLPNDDAKITLEGFYKTYADYPFSVKDSVAIASKGGDYGTFGDEEVVSQSNGRSFGLEVLFREKMLKGINIITSYTLVRGEFENVEGKFIPTSWDNKHLLNVTATKSFKRNWDFGFKWRFVGGAPYTPYDLDKSSFKNAWDIYGRAYLDYSRFNEERLSNFHQLDVRLDKQYFFKNWSMLFYLDIQNLYNFKGEEQDIVLLDKDADGNPIILNPNDPIEQHQYKLNSITSESGTVLPTIGIIVEF